MYEPFTIDELFTEWVKENQDKIRFAAWIKTLTKQEVEDYKQKFSRCEDAPCCGCCD